MAVQTDFGPNRRTKGRVKKIFGPMVDLAVVEGGAMCRTQARIVDYHEGGYGFLSHDPISPGSVVTFTDEAGEARKAKVTWCQKTRGSEYRLGVSFMLTAADDAEEGGEPSDETVDYYELLQLNPKADTETIHRIYRLQAQRFHPDNKETGDAAVFKVLHEAYTVLSDPEKRAAYDVKLNRVQQKRWKIFEKPAEAQGIEAEKKKRAGILALLYTKRIQSPGTPSMSIADFENLLGVPKEHLEFALWYLRENGSVSRSDNARFAISVKGVDEVERTPEAVGPQRVTQPDRLIAAR